MTSRPLVTVGIPTFNRPRRLQRALDSIRAQSYENLDIVISDNASPSPLVERVLNNAVGADSRIRYFPQVNNIGPGENFIFVLRQAKGSFFMWAADDDEWHPEFIEKLLRPLLCDPRSGFSFCDFDVRYPDGNECLAYGSFPEAFSEFLHNRAPERVTRYATQAPERGKANLIYGLYRIEALSVGSASRFFGYNAWGTDMLFVCDVLSRWSFNFVPEKLYIVETTYPLSSQAFSGDSCLPPGRSFGDFFSLVLSHARYIAMFFQIMSRTPGATIFDFGSLSVRLLPQLWFFIKSDLASLRQRRW